MHQTVIVKKFFQHQNNLETKCVYLTHINIYSPSTILHMSPLGDAVRSMCSTYKKKNFRAYSFKIYEWNMSKPSLEKQSIVDFCMESPKREFVASYHMKTSTHSKNHCLPMSFEVRYFYLILLSKK